VHTESTGTTAVGVAALIIAAIAVVLTRRRWLFMAVAVLAAGYASLDVREALHQHDETRSGLVAAAIALAVAHLIGCALGLIAARRAAATISVS
jgi:hypothetical protein